ALPIDRQLDASDGPPDHAGHELRHRYCRPNAVCVQGACKVVGTRGGKRSFSSESRQVHGRRSSDDLYKPRVGEPEVISRDGTGPSANASPSLANSACRGSAAQCGQGIVQSRLGDQNVAPAKHLTEGQELNTHPSISRAGNKRAYI